jgi:hypothetical protein
MTEAIATAETQPSTTVPAHRMTIDGIVDRETEPPATATSPAVAGRRDNSYLEVRVLTNRPRIDGSGDSGVFAGNGRHFELVALLASSDGLTKDQIRTAIYGSGSSVENISRNVTQARQMLGADAAGDPWLPPADGRGIVRLSSRVTSDLERLCDATSAAAAAGDPAASIALYGSALDLIDAGPGSVIDHAWNWWPPFAAVAAEAAANCAVDLTRLTIDTGGDFAAARAGIGRARAVAPWTEALYRSAIELAGVCGDLGQAQVEWDALVRMLKELAPDAAPSSETEMLYRQVMRRAVATVR